jgi:type I restriction enzyme R subunit
VEEGKIYEEDDFNRIIEIKERESYRVKLFMDEINQSEKAIVFCATQEHAGAVRDLINQNRSGTKSCASNPHYCVRVTANDGARGEQFLRDFQDNDKTIPTILTTSQKLSTGVDARNIRNIVLMRPVNSMIEFKQIVGRGTRLFDGKEYFTILDFVDAYKHFSDPEWDGEPIDNTTEREPKPDRETKPKEAKEDSDKEPKEKRKRLVIKLRNGKEREIQHMMSTSFWSADGKPISTQEFMDNLCGDMPDFFKNEDELREIWSNPKTRKAFLDKLAEAGYGKEELENLQKVVDAEQSDLFDVLSYLSFESQPITRTERVKQTEKDILGGLEPRQIEFLDFVLANYIEKGVDELSEDKLPVLLNLKYHSIADASDELGGVEKIRDMFFGFQKNLYEKLDTNPAFV